jgi:hypothetical protein
LEVERVGRRKGDGAEGNFESAVLEAKADGEDIGLNLERQERRCFEPTADLFTATFCTLSSFFIISTEAVGLNQSIEA